VTDEDPKDRRRPTPYAGVPTRVVEAWEGRRFDTPPAGVPIAAGDTLHKIDRRVKLTAQAMQNTFDSVGELRREMDVKVDRIDVKVDALASDLADVRESTGRHEGKLDVMMAGLADDREERHQRTTMTVTAFTAGVEIDKTRALSAIEEQALRNAHRRQIVFRVLAGVGAVWALLSTIALARCM